MVQRIVSTAAALMCAAMPAGAQSRSRSAPADSALLALTLDAATRVVSSYTSADSLTPRGGWIVRLAPEIPRTAGSRIASELRRELTLRDTTTRDSARTIVTIHPPQITPDSFHVLISVGDWFRCPRVAATAETTFEVNGVRRTGGWTWTPPTELSESITLACRQAAPPVIMPSFPVGRGRRGGFGGG